MNNTPPPAPPVEPPVNTLHASFLKSLQLSVDDTKPQTHFSDGAPVPDTGAPRESNLDFSQKSGSLVDVMSDLERKVTAPVVTPPAPVPPVETPPVAAAPVVPETPPVTPPVPAPTPELTRVKVPVMPKPLFEDTVLPPPPSSLDLNGLDEDEQEEVQTALFAEQRYPQKYAGHAKKVLDFIKSHKTYVRELEAQDPNVSFDSDNTAYNAWLSKNRPSITNSERKRLERERLLEEAAGMAEKKFSAKTKKLEEEVLQLKATPLVEKTLNDYKSLLKELMPKDEDPLVVNEVQDKTNKAVVAAQEFLQLSSGLKPYDSTSDTHRWLGDFIEEQGQLYLASKHDSLKRGSKTFLPRAKYNGLPAAERAKHWTFTDEDVLQLIAVNAKAAAEYHSNNEKERLKKAGYSRNAPTAPPAPVTPPPVQPTAEPSARATPTIVGSAPSANPTPVDPFQKWMAGTR